MMPYRRGQLVRLAPLIRPLVELLFRLSARRVPFTMHQALQPGLTAARYCAIVPGGFTPYLQQQFTFCRRLRDWPLPKAGRAA